MFTHLQQRNVSESNAAVETAVRELPLNANNALLLGLLIISALSGVVLIV
jgi:hypothetical protein